MSEKKKITLSIISHTNIGKTTLTRTLLRSDVGEVRDQDHVTLESKSFLLAESDSAELYIWDTPGFGGKYPARLMKRLRSEGTASGWFMHEVVDRFGNRSLYSSLEAARNVRAEADVVLYLVNARERPEDAGYVRAELELLQELGKPVLLVINQVEERSGIEDYPAYIRTLEKSWSDAFDSFPALKGSMVLDAYSRTWLQELQVFDRVRPLLPESKRPLLEELGNSYRLEQENILSRCAAAAAETLHYAAIQELDYNGGKKDKELFRQLYAELQAKLDGYVETLMLEHSLEAQNNPELEADIANVQGLALKKLPEKEFSFISAAISGAGGGLAADLMSGGLTFGGGALIGFIIGGLSGLTAARSFNYLITRGKRCRWSGQFLVDLFRQLLFFYLLIAHHGRGKGLVVFEKRVRIWSGALEQAFAPHVDEINSVLEEVKKEPGNPQSSLQLSSTFENIARETLSVLYPDYPGEER